MMRQPLTESIFVLLIFACFCSDRTFCDEPVSSPHSRQVCVIADERINESSGLARSLRQSDAIWTHNDSGDTARLFLVGMDGSTRGVFPLKDVPRPVDWEDMCGFTVGDEPWLMIGDVGDNATHRHIVTPDEGEKRACRLLLFHEPVLKDGIEQDSVPVHTTIVFEYEDGPHNCESIAVDTERGECVLVSKSKSTPLDCGIYSIPLTLTAGTTTATARRIGSLDIYNATAMDIAPDNHRMAIISFKGASIVERTDDETWGDAIKREPFFMTLPRRKGGESVCFGRNRDELLLNSEHVRQPLWSVQISAFGAAP